MEEVILQENLEKKIYKTVMYSEHQSDSRWKNILKTLKHKNEDYKKEYYNVYVYCTLPYPPDPNNKKPQIRLNDIK